MNLAGSATVHGKEIAEVDAFPDVIRPTELEALLRELRLRYPEQGLELRAAGTSTLGELAPILGAMRRAGYPRFWVFGNRSSILELTSRVAGTQ